LPGAPRAGGGGVLLLQRQHYGRSYSGRHGMLLELDKLVQSCSCFKLADFRVGLAVLLAVG
jgi:hypothetical protein